MKIRQVIAWLVVLPWLALAASCSDDSGGSGGGCQDLTGDWKLEGSCPPGLCTVKVNSACQMTVKCDDGTNLSGTVSGQSFSLSGSSSCSGSVAKKDGTISCSSSAGSCSSSLECESGTCLNPTQIGGSSSVAFSAFCSKCAECVKEADFSEGYCDHYTVNGKFDTQKCVEAASTESLDDPTASASEIASWSCQEFDDHE